MHILPGWLWVVVMVVLVIVGVATGDPAAFLVVGASVGLMVLIVLIRNAFNSEGFGNREGSGTLSPRHVLHLETHADGSRTGYGTCPKKRSDIQVSFPPKCSTTNCPACGKTLYRTYPSSSPSSNEDYATIKKQKCSRCGKMVCLQAPPSTFYATCPECGGQVYIGP